jgi:hypothetical protein
MPTRVVDFGGHLCHNVSWLSMETAMGEGFWSGVLMGFGFALFAVAIACGALGEGVVGAALCFMAMACAGTVMLRETKILR